MYSKARFVFYAVLSLYLITLFTVSYVGVYLTYIAIPLIVISGLIMRCTKPKPKPATEQQQAVHTAVENALSGVSSTVASFSSSLQRFNAKNELIQQRTQSHKMKIHELNMKKIEPEVNLKYEEEPGKRAQYEAEIRTIEGEIEAIELEIESIERACELEIARQSQQPNT